MFETDEDGVLLWPRRTAVPAFVVVSAGMEAGRRALNGWWFQKEPPLQLRGILVWTEVVERALCGAANALCALSAARPGPSGTPGTAGGIGFGDLCCFAATTLSFGERATPRELT